jgi:hypothetical protein
MQVVVVHQPLIRVVVLLAQAGVVVLVEATLVVKQVLRLLVIQVLVVEVAVISVELQVGPVGQVL